MTVSRRAVLGSAAGAAAAALGGSALATAPGASAAVGDQPVDAAAVVAAARHAADHAVDRIAATAAQGKGFPVGTRAEKWIYSPDGGWTAGFWPGSLWMAYLYSGDERFRNWALQWATKQAAHRYDTSSHDLGFMFYPSWATAWRLTRDHVWRDGSINAAQSLIKRYNPRGRYIRAWGALGTPTDAGRVIIDTMMNLDLLHFAGQYTGSHTYMDIAVAHTETVQKYVVRPDGSTPHCFDFDPDTGAPIGQNTVQGYSPLSSWSRGQAWAIYGFTTMGRRTGRHDFLVTATALANYALAVLSPDAVPVWDYRAPQAPFDVKDASAGAVMACGLLDLAVVTGSSRYRRAGLQILYSLCKTCLTDHSSRAESVMTRCTSNRPAESGIEIGLPYGDYYLFETIMRVLDRTKLSGAIDLT